MGLFSSNICVNCHKPTQHPIKAVARIYELGTVCVRKVTVCPECYVEHKIK